jgi:hypothetical protein
VVVLPDPGGEDCAAGYVSVWTRPPLVYGPDIITVFRCIDHGIATLRVADDGYRM